MNKKRLLSLMLCGIIGVGSTAALGGCGKKEENYDFSVWVPLVNSAVGEYKDHQVFQELERRTGKKVKFVHDSYDNLEKYYLSNTYCDVMIFNDQQPSFAGTYNGGVEKGIADGKIIDVSDKMATLAPNYTKIVNSSDAIKQEAVMDDGRMTAFYEITDSDTDPWYGYMMREDWLAKVPGFGNGTEVTQIPQTYDDWEIVMKKFTEFNGGQAPFFLYSAGVDPFNLISAGYDTTFDFQFDKTGKVTYGPYMDEFEGYLNRMQSWFRKGWIDPKFNDSTAYVAITDAVGSMSSDAQYGIFTQMYIYMTPYEKTAHRYGREDYSLIAVPNPVQTRGQKLHIRQKNVRAGNYAVITDKCKDVDGVMQWLDYLYSDEGQLLMNYGIEDVSYTMVDGRPQYTELVTDNPKYVPADVIKKYAVQGFPSYLDMSRETQVAKPKEIEAMKVWKENNDASYVMPVVSVSLAESNDFGVTMAGLETYTKEFIVNYIANTAEKQTFAAYRAKLKEYGIEKAIATKQAAYERWLKRV